MRLADAVITLSAEEAVAMTAATPGINVHVVPLSLTPIKRTIPTRHRSGIAFLGSYHHAPAADAVRWLHDAVMPLVWARDPDMTCRIIGADWPERLARSMDPRMRFMGVIPRLATAFDQVRLTVAPYRFGSGTEAGC